MQRELTAAQREQLAGLMPFSPGATDRFTPELFNAVDEALRPVFLLRPYTQAEKDKIVDVMKRLVANPASVEEKDVTEFARMAVAGWENVMDVATGDDIEYKPGPNNGADRETFNLLPRATVNAIMTRANKISGLLSAEALGLRY